MFTVKLVMPIFSSALQVAQISSISAVFDLLPIMSMSHWVNWRIRPFCGCSARKTSPIWINLQTLGSSFLLLAKNLASGSVRSYLSPMSARSEEPASIAFFSFSPRFIMRKISFRFSPPSLLSRFSMLSSIGVAMELKP